MSSLLPLDTFLNGISVVVRGVVNAYLKITGTNETVKKKHVQIPVILYSIMHAPSVTLHLSLIHI